MGEMDREMIKTKLKLITQIEKLLLKEELVIFSDIKKEYKDGRKMDVATEDFLNEAIFNYKNFFIVKTKKEREIVDKTEPINSFLIGRMNEKIKFILKFKDEISNGNMEFVYQLMIKGKINWRQEDEMFLDDIFNVLIQKLKVDAEFEKLKNLEEKK